MSDLVQVTDEAELADALRHHVRARAQLAENSDQRRICVRELMIDNVWSTPEHAPICAELWSLTVNAVIGIASECSRWMRINLGPEGEARLRERLMAKTHEMLDLVREPKDLADVGRVALPLAGVAKRALVFVVGGREIRAEPDQARMLLDMIGRAILEAPADMTMGEWRESVLPGRLGT